jgi:RimJ/RimL family protein N-acetyltransferase
VSLVPPDPPLSDGVIVLRPLDERDLPAIERAASDAEILKWFDLHTRSPADYLAAKREAWAQATGASFAICDATGPDTCLGQVFIERDGEGRGSVGYWLLEDGRGRGRATCAVRLIGSWALPEMRVGRLQLLTDPENIASQRVAERAGFTREGVLRAYNGRPDGTRADAVVYSLLPQDLAPTRSCQSLYGTTLTAAALECSPPSPPAADGTGGSASASTETRSASTSRWVAAGSHGRTPTPKL